MKKILFITVIAVLVSSSGLRSQNIQSDLNQVELMKQLLGDWRIVSESDTVICFQFLKYENAIAQTNYRLINGKKHLTYQDSYKYDPATGRINNSNESGIWTGYFIDEKTLKFEKFESRGSNKVIERRDIVFESPVEMVGIYYNPEGIKVWEVRSTKFPTIQSETVNPGLNQLELMKKLIGTWNSYSGNDTIRGIDFEKYDNAFTGNDFVIINGKKIVFDRWSFGYSKSDNNFKMFALFPNGGYLTRIGYFTSENRFVQEEVENFNHEKMFGIVEIILDTPTSITGRFRNLNGETKLEAKFTKVK